VLLLAIEASRFNPMFMSDGKWNPICPSCGSAIEPTTTNDGIVFTCAQCGWNNAHVRSKIRKQIIYSAAFVLIGLVLLLVGAFSGAGTGIVIYLTAMAAAVWAAISWKPWRTLQKLDATRSNQISELPSGFSCAPAPFIALIPTPEEAQDLFGNVLSAARPRPLTWLWPARIGVAILLFCLVIDVWSLISIRAVSKGDWTAAFTVAIFVTGIALVFGLPLLPDLSKRGLIQLGEVSVGRVILQTQVGAGRNSWVSTSYAFLDAAGRGFIGQGVSYDDGLGKGAPLVVFYDSLDPNRNVAMDCSRIKVKIS
jgi:predicted RNA-binding Zn-ribbon protein involved in translation (DUF1610 family)